MRMGEIPLGMTEQQYRADPPPPKRPDGKPFSLWGSDGFGFDDLVDVVNPLQHLPVVSVLYRELTGDEIGFAPRLLGGGLYGGVIGAVSSVANILIEDATGKDFGGHVMTALFEGGGGRPAEPPVMVAKTGAGAYARAAGLATPPEPAAAQMIGGFRNGGTVVA